MATEASATALRTALGKVLVFRDKKLESRPEWGAITFEKAAPDLRRIFELLSHLSVLPLEYLTDSAISQIQSNVIETENVLAGVDKFNIEQQNPSAVRDQLSSEIHRKADDLYQVAGPWVPVLAYQRGDVAKNIESLTASVTHAQTLVDNAKTTIASRQVEIEEIITKAREASAAAGAAVFTQDFQREAAALDVRATKWLRATVVMAAITLAVTVLILLLHLETDPTTALQRFGAKIAALVVLFTATLWCGRTYKALTHLSVVYRHRALCLQTFQAFSQAASDNATKDAVLMESTRAVFGSVPTGFVDSSSTEQDLKIVEVAKSFTKTEAK
jgi:hypothetical protein